MATSVMDGKGRRAGRTTRPNREGVKVCPRCGAKTFADMDVCYGCLYDFTTGEGEVSLEGIRHENDGEPWSPFGGSWGLDEPESHQFGRTVVEDCASDVAELFSCPPGAGFALNPARVCGERPLVISDARTPGEPEPGVERACAVSASALASGEGGGVPRCERRCKEDTPCIRVIAPDIPVVVEVMGPNVTVRQLWQSGRSFDVCTEAENGRRVGGECSAADVRVYGEGEAEPAPLSDEGRARMGSQSSDGAEQ